MTNYIEEVRRTINMETGKKFWTSKTLWVNIVAIIAMIVQFYKQDFILTPEIQFSILAVINIILRLITKEEIVWDDTEPRKK
jgi:hypothetical protein